MRGTGAGPAVKALVWVLVVTAMIAPVIAAANSPLLAWRDPIYIAAGFAGILGLSLMLLQPLLAGGDLPGLSGMRGRRVHRIVGGLLLVAVILHVAGLWVTSPPDVVDALLFVSPTPFSAWGVIAMWAVIASGVFAALRRRMRVPPRVWRRFHTALAVVIVMGTVVHAVQIEGTMETVTKLGLCALVIAATIRTVVKLQVLAKRPRRRTGA